MPSWWKELCRGALMVQLFCVSGSGSFKARRCPGRVSDLKAQTYKMLLVVGVRSKRVKSPPRCILNTCARLGE